MRPIAEYCNGWMLYFEANKTYVGVLATFVQQRFYYLLQILRSPAEKALS